MLFTFINLLIKDDEAHAEQSVSDTRLDWLPPYAAASQLLSARTAP